MSRELKMKMIFDLAQKVTGPMKKISVGSKAMTADLRQSRSELKALEKTQGQIAGFRKLKVGLRDTSKELDAANKRTAALAKTIGGTDKPTRAMNREFQAAQNQSTALKKKFQSQQIELQELRNDLKGAGVSTGELSDGQRKLKDQISQTNKKINDQKSRLGELSANEAKIADGRARMEQTQQRASTLAVGGAASVGAGFALAAPIAEASREAITFEGKMIDIKKVLNDVTPKELIGIEKGLISMSGRMPIAAEGLGHIAAEGARAGVAAKDLLPFTENAAKMAAAFDISADAAGDMTAKWLTGLDLTIPQTTILGDKVNALTNNFGGAASKVTDMITRIGPLGKVAGIASGEMAAMSQLMISSGVESQIGATGIKRMMLTLNVGAAATDKQAAAFGRLGLDAEKMATTMQTDAKGGILSVLDAINQLPKEQQAGVLTQLFGSESVASIAPMLSRLDLLKRNFQLIGDESRFAGSMNAEFGVAMSKTENQVKTASNAIDSAQIALGQQLIPSIKIGAGYIKDIGVGIAEWAGEHPNLVKGIGLTVGIMAALLIVVGGLAIGIAAIMGPFAMLRFSMMMAGGNAKSLKAGWAALTTSMKTGRIKAAALWMRATGLAALSMGKRMLIAGAQYSVMAGRFVAGKIASGATALLGFGKAAAFAGLSFLKAGLMMMLSPIGLVVLAVGALAAGAYLIYKNWDKVGPWFQNLWSNTKQIFWTAWEGIKNLFLNYTPHGLIIKHWDSISAWFGVLWTNVKGVFSVGWETIKTLFLNYTPHGLIIKHWSTITAWFGNLWVNVKGAFANGWTNIKSLATAWPSNMMSIGKQIIAGLANGIKAAPGAVWNALQNVVMGGVGKVKGWLGIKSPSRVFMGIGGHVGDGLAIGIDNKVSRTRAAMKKMTAGVLAAAAINIPAASFADTNVSARNAILKINLQKDDVGSKIFNQNSTHQTLQNFQYNTSNIANSIIDGPTPQPLPVINAPIAKPLRADNPDNIAKRNVRNSGAQASTFSPTINIYQKDGEDSKALAERIMKMMKDMQREHDGSDYEDDF